MDSSWRATVLGRAGRSAATGAALAGLVVTSLPADRVSAGGGSEAVSGAGDVSLTAAGTALRRPGRAWPGHPGRRIVRYTVHRGDTATGIATRFHAWTAELLRLNHKRPSSTWYVGERVRVPVVVARAHAHGHAVGASHKPRHHKPRHHKPRHHKPRHHAHHPGRHPSQARVRDEIVRVARQHGVRPKLALAIAWQESGWRQHVRSSAGAVGAMQVMPGTGRWISSLLGHRLHLRRLHDNVTAGVVLFDLLRRDHSVRTSIAAYYQGLGSIRAHGRYPSTKRYVRNVTAHWRALRHGWRPLA